MTALAASLAGLAVAVYLTAVHFEAGDLVCSTGGIVNCERVLSSPYGVVAGTPVPTAALGVFWFAVAAALATLRLRADTSGLRLAHLLWSGAGLLTVLGLVFVEIDVLGAICAWCTAAHVLVLVTFLAVLAAQQLPDGDVGRRRAP